MSNTKFYCMLDDEKYNAFVALLQKLAEYSVVPFICYTYLTMLHTYTNQQFLDMISLHVSTQYATLFASLCGQTGIDANNVPLIYIQKFCTYIDYFQHKILASE